MSSRDRIRAVLAATGVGEWTLRMLRGRALAVCLGIALLITTLLAGLAAIPESAPGATSGSVTQPAASRAAPVPAASAGALTPTPAADPIPDELVLGGEDPVAATVQLLRLRVRCIEELAAACVSGYAEPASALADADARAMSESDVTGILLAETAFPDVQMVQTYGDAVLLHVTPAREKRQPVSVLAVRTDTGWRLRDLFETD